MQPGEEAPASPEEVAEVEQPGEAGEAGEAGEESQAAADPEREAAEKEVAEVEQPSAVSEAAEDAQAAAAPEADTAEAEAATAQAAEPGAAAETSVQAEFSDDPEAALDDETEFFDDEGDEELEFGVVAEVEAPPREPTKRTLKAEQLTRIPGTRGDALRAIEIMPGVARVPFGETDGAPPLRGGSSNEGLVVIDGAQVPLLYHFGGLTSFFNSQLLESVDLYPGNYSARYGRKAGGVVDAKVRDPKSDRFHAMLELSAIDSFAMVESPVGDQTSVALSARRSNIDFFFESFVPDNAYSVLAAPVYWDYQAIVAHRFNEQHQLRVLGYGSQDRLKLLFDDAAEGDPALRGSVDGRFAFHRGQIELSSQFSDSVAQKTMLSVGPSSSDQTLGELQSKFRFVDLNLRSEWSFFVSDAVRLDAGLDFEMFTGRGDYRGPAPIQDEGNPLEDALASEEYFTVSSRVLTPLRPGAYLEASLRPTANLLLVPGLRADYIGDGQDWTIDPRLSSRYEVQPGTTLKAGVGSYSQPPEFYELIEDLGNPELTPFRTLQTSFGFEQQMFEGVKLDVEGFYKRWFDRPVGTEGGAPPRFVNQGVGRAYGLETLFDVRPSPRTQAFVSYTLSRSERNDASRGWRLFDEDQTHNLSLTANYDLGKGWIVGGRFRFVTGNPTTAVVASVYDASTDTYRAIYGGINDERNSAFHQLDVRAEKRFELGPVSLTTYLEVMNVYNKQNIEGTDYSFDFSQSQGATGMPFFPNLGIRGEL